MLDLGSARHWARALQERAAFEGAVAVDATVGNGGDTQALCAMVGETGRVYGFDVQERALECTRARLREAGLEGRARLFHMGHEHMAEVTPAGVDLVVFNLGWLPGAPDKGVTTRADTTIAALEAALSLLKKGGLITVCAYPGHEEGAKELRAVAHWARTLNASLAQTLFQGYMNQPSAPALIALVKLK